MVVLVVVVDEVMEGTHGAKLSEGDASVSVLVGVDDGLVHDLLQLRVLQVVAHHHLQHLEQLPVGDVAVLVHVVDPEGDWETPSPHVIIIIIIIIILITACADRGDEGMREVGMRGGGMREGGMRGGGMREGEMRKVGMKGGGMREGGMRARDERGRDER